MSQNVWSLPLLVTLRRPPPPPLKCDVIYGCPLIVHPQPGLNRRTVGLEASTLSRDHCRRQKYILPDDFKNPILRGKYATYSSLGNHSCHFFDWLTDRIKLELGQETEETSTLRKTCWKCRDNDERPTGKNATIEWEDCEKINSNLNLTEILPSVHETWYIKVLLTYWC